MNTRLRAGKSPCDVVHKLNPAGNLSIGCMINFIDKTGCLFTQRRYR